MAGPGMRLLLPCGFRASTPRRDPFRLLKRRACSRRPGPGTRVGVAYALRKWSAHEQACLLISSWICTIFQVHPMCTPHTARTLELELFNKKKNQSFAREKKSHDGVLENKWVNWRYTITTFKS